MRSRWKCVCKSDFSEFDWSQFLRNFNKFLNKIFLHWGGEFKSLIWFNFEKNRKKKINELRRNCKSSKIELKFGLIWLKFSWAHKNFLTPFAIKSKEGHKVSSFNFPHAYKSENYKFLLSTFFTQKAKPTLVVQQLNLFPFPRITNQHFWRKFISASN